MQDIQNRADISRLVHAFYDKIRQNDLLGPIFNQHIQEDAWETHLEHLTDFWETNLFGIPKFKGSPSRKHINVDKNMGHSITQVHFGKWLELWFQTIEELFEGEIAERAKYAARKMATGQFLVMYNSRPENMPDSGNLKNIL